MRKHTEEELFPMATEEERTLVEGIALSTKEFNDMMIEFGYHDLEAKCMTLLRKLDEIGCERPYDFLPEGVDKELVLHAEMIFNSEELEQHLFKPKLSKSDFEDLSPYITYRAMTPENGGWKLSIWSSYDGMYSMKGFHEMFSMFGTSHFCSRIDQAIALIEKSTFERPGSERYSGEEYMNLCKDKKKKTVRRRAMFDHWESDRDDCSWPTLALLRMRPVCSLWSKEDLEGLMPEHTNTILGNAMAHGNLRAKMALCSTTDIESFEVDRTIFLAGRKQMSYFRNVLEHVDDGRLYDIRLFVKMCNDAGFPNKLYLTSMERNVLLSFRGWKFLLKDSEMSTMFSIIRA